MTDKPVTEVSERERAREFMISMYGAENEALLDDEEREDLSELMTAYRREGVREALLRYGQHGASCTATLGQGKPCDCGFTAELEGADQSC